MNDITIKTLDGGTTTITGGELDALNGGLRGAVALRGDDGYDDARTIWNAMIDRHPAIVIRCLGASDIMKSVVFAREKNLLCAVRSGGHNIAGNAVCEGGLLIDLSQMKSVNVDAAAKTAVVEPAASLGDVDKECQAFGLSVPVGINSTTGIAGLTLGGGFGWTTRKFGMTIDSLVSADVVTAEGKLIRASENENADLFWAIRGGGGNFGIVAAFTFKLHVVGPEVLAGLIVHPFENGRKLFAKYRELVADAPDELTCWVVLRKAPPLPFLPEEWHGKEVFVLALCYAGNIADGERVAAPFRAVGEPIADVVGPTPFVGWQSAFDPLLTPGARNYWKSHDLNALSDPAVDIILDYAGRLPTPECEIFIAQIGGEMARIPADATAYPNRDAHFIMNVHTRWQDSKDDDVCVGWAREFFDASAPHSSGTVYVNFMPEDESGRVEKAYGPNYARLASAKAKYDPTNFFRLNQNISPSG